MHIKFANKQKLKKHVEAVHEGIKPFKCSVCDVKFANNYNPLIQERYLLHLQINKIHRNMLKLFMKDSNLSSAVFVMSSLEITTIHRFRNHRFRNGIY